MHFDEDEDRGHLSSALGECETLQGASGENDADRLLHELHLHQTELEVQNRDLKESQQALEEARDRYAGLYDFAPVGYLTLDRQGVIRNLNLTAATLLGRDRARLVGMPLATLISPVPSGALYDHLRETFSSNQRVTVDLPFRMTAEGPVRCFKLDSNVHQDAEGGKTCLTTLIDISERKQAEEALKKSEERFDLAMRGSNDGVFDWDLRTNDVYYSPRWKAMLGYDDKELKNHRSTWEQLVEPEDGVRSREMLCDYMDGRRDDYQMEFRMRHKDGHWVDILSRAQLVRDEHGSPVRVVGTHVDHTQYKLAHRQLVAEHNRAQEYLDVAGVMLIALDTFGRVQLINPKGREILDLEDEEILGRDWFDSFFANDDAIRSREVFNRLLAGDVESVEYAETPVLTGQGNQRLIAWHHGVVRDEQGRVVGTLSSGEDVTERDQAQQSLSRERSFLQHVIDGIADPILVINPDFELVRMNRAAKDVSDQSESSESYLDFHLTFHKREDQTRSGEDPQCPLQTVLDTRAPCKVVHRHLAPSGEIRQFEVAASPLFDDEGEITGIIETFREITEHLALLDELRERELSYVHLAQHDPLTELPNRLLFADRLGQAIHEAHRDRLTMAVLFVDLDGFKHVNDSFDHSHGDEVLKAVASRLRSLFREDDTIARMGGDEFTVILRDIGHADAAASVARKVLEIFEEPFKVGGHRIVLGASIGISLYPQHGESVDDLVRNADAAMYRAKEAGRHTFQYYTRELTDKAFERISLESSLHKALELDEIELFYQGQVNLLTGVLCGVEALVRWRLPGVEMIPPAKFIPLAEETGIIVLLGEWVLREACRRMKVWQDTGVVPGNTPISVNLSAKQFNRSDLIDTIQGILDETGLAPSSLELEITESTMMLATDLSALVLRQVRDMGIKVAIDDFGTGYCSLNYLKRLPITRLKIDQSFVSEIPHDSNDIAIARAIIAMAKSLSLDVLAEGIETREQQAFLINEGCYAGQGYFFQKPLPAQDFEASVREIVY